MMGVGSYFGRHVADMVALPPSADRQLADMAEGRAETLHRQLQAVAQGDRAALPRIVGASRADPFSPLSVSGIPHHLFDALERRYDMVGRIDTRLSVGRAALVALATFTPSRAAWIERYFKNTRAFRWQSDASRQQLARLSRPFDVVVQVYGLFRTLGAPYVMYLDNTHEISVHQWPGWNPLQGRDLERWYALEREAYQGALHVFVTSEPIARSVTGFYGVPAERVSIVGAGANVDVLPPLPDRATREPIILFVGREYRRKGGDVLVEAFRRVRAAFPAARLQIVGTNAAPREPGVEVLGSVSDRGQLARLYARASIFCLPSRFDPYPGVLAEAMAHWLPCVSTRTCGIPEIVVEGETGLLVPRDDADALGGALLRLLEDPAYRDRLGAAGRLRVERRLTWDHVVDRMSDVLDRVGENRPNDGRHGTYVPSGESRWRR